MKRPTLFFFSRLFWVFDVYFSFIKILGLFSFCKKCHGCFDRHYIKSVDYSDYYGYFNNINSSNLCMVGMLPFLCIVFSFLDQFHIIFSVIGLSPLVKFVSKYFILSDVIVNKIVFLLLLSDS